MQMLLSLIYMKLFYTNKVKDEHLKQQPGKVTRLTPKRIYDYLMSK